MTPGMAKINTKASHKKAEKKFEVRLVEFDKNEVRSLFGKLRNKYKI